jgi:hypothetical protein
MSSDSKIGKTVTHEILRKGNDPRMQVLEKLSHSSLCRTLEPSRTLIMYEIVVLIPVVALLAMIRSQ